jgi:ferredoxin
MYTNDSSMYFVMNQPVDEREEEDIQRAMDVCPMECIKADGVAA